MSGKEKVKTMEEVLSPLKGMMEKLDNAVSQKAKEEDSVPWDRATIQKEYKRCRNALCECNANYNKPKKTHGPYLYAYWKDNGKLNKKYIGKSVKEYKDKLHMKAYNEITGKNWTFTQWNKYNYIRLVAECGSKVAEDYERKLGIISGKRQLDEIVMEVFNEHGDGTDMKQGRVPSIDWAFRVVRKEVDRNLELKRKIYAKIERKW
jgi:hypothetical protein